MLDALGSLQELHGEGVHVDQILEVLPQGEVEINGKVKPERRKKLTLVNAQIIGYCTDFLTMYGRT